MIFCVVYYNNFNSTSHGHGFGEALILHVSSRLQGQEDRKNKETRTPVGAEPEREKGKRVLSKMVLSWWMFVPEAPWIWKLQ